MVLGLEFSELRYISLGLQLATLLIFIIGLIQLKKSDSKKEGITKHGKTITSGYALALISVLYMIYSAYYLINAGIFTLLIYIHGSLGLIALALGFIFVINRWSWKTLRNMRIQLILWLLVFSGGIFLYFILT